VSSLSARNTQQISGRGQIQIPIRKKGGRGASKGLGRVARVSECRDAADNCQVYDV